MADTTPINKQALIDHLVNQVGLKPDAAKQAIDHVVSELFFAKSGRLLADQACQSCGAGGAAAQ